MFFKPKGPLSLRTDIHSHLLPAVDDGAKSMEEALLLIRCFHSLGYKHLVTTPHISENYYPNSHKFLKDRMEELQSEVAKTNLDVSLTLGAEYMVDGRLQEMVKQKEPLLSWQGYVLIETSFHSLPWITEELIFEMIAQGYTPVLAHPERYSYFFDKPEDLLNLKKTGIKFQATIGSFVGQYGDQQKKMAKWLLKQHAVDFLGSDVHRIKHAALLREGLQYKSLRKRQAGDFLNDTLTL